MIKADNLVKKYGNFELDISMEVQEGYITGLVGKNGAGKSTAIKLILGLIRPDSGNITVLGKMPCELTGKDKQKLGVTLSEAGFSTYLNVKDIIRILKKLYYDFDEGEFRSRCDKLSIPLDKNIKDFSTGMRAKLRMLWHSAITRGCSYLMSRQPGLMLTQETGSSICCAIIWKKDLTAAY